MWKIPLFDLSYDQREQEAVMDVLQSKWLSMGPKTNVFEQNFAEYLGRNVRCCAVSSCTAALHIALLAAGVGPGDEVILSGLTFIAALNVVILVGATPVLADSKSLDDWNVSPEDVARKITPQTKAVILVHYAGYPCDMDELTTLCVEKKLVLIEDVAHAVGAEYKGKKCGTFGDIACFSFFSNKNLSVGEGGMFVTPHEEFDRKARLFRSHGMTSMTIDRHKGKSLSYDVVQPGLNYRIDEIRSALGIVQLEKLDFNNKRRSELVREYIHCFELLKEIVIPWKNLMSGRISSYHIFPILLSLHTSRPEFMDFLKKKEIQTSIHYPAFTQFLFYQNMVKERLDIAEEISKRVVTLPLFPGMTVDNVHYVSDAVIEFFKNKDGLI